jgi:hypothetical protein
MKALTLSIAATALLALGATQALAHPSQARATRTVMVVMHDPGCHWFSVGGAYKTTLSIKGPVKLRNFDEATLKVAGPSGIKLDAVGKQLALAPGVYHITMVGQAPDDNHLKLVVT